MTEASVKIEEGVKPFSVAINATQREIIAKNKKLKAVKENYGIVTSPNKMMQVISHLSKDIAQYEYVFATSRGVKRSDIGKELRRLENKRTKLRGLDPLALAGIEIKLESDIETLKKEHNILEMLSLQHQ